ncbi:uncharacterized protein CIMG_01800 [Coccidioides immitis RS]|uniref:Uncharacterized protein n=1 Tax=Coccidioides immitis (strain RS) TaxID=246410 RepID=J3KJY8_COCIM|nr:uncharacterized protein CIMG_01800 [Coccidioides immitis RS]EAS36446.3 hypothetical protein CIMG_01800 [Coccidioides immitis RS]
MSQSVSSPVHPAVESSWTLRQACSRDAEKLFWRNDVAGWLSGRSCEPPDASLASYIIL